jgi:predicted small lipoprotein YifL
MKKVISILLVLVMVFSLGACSKPAEAPAEKPAETPAETPAAETPAAEAPKTEAEAFEGKIAIVTNTLSQNEEEYRSAQQMVEKYGEDKVSHVLWPDNFMTEQEQMISTITKIGSDPDVKALIINQAVPGTNAAVDKLLETRDDMFIVYCAPQENPPDVAARANLILQPDELGMGDSIPEQAKAMGAKTFVHYSFPRHMSVVLLSARRDLMITKCEEIGLEFVDATAPDPTGDAGVPGAQQFILEDVPKMVEKYGKDTAFFSTNCSMQTPLIKATFDAGAIYPQPCCPSPYHGYPSALGIESTGYTVDAMAQVISETAKKLKEGGVLGRFSTWPVPVAMMNTVAGAEYAVKWINGEVGDELDTAVLEGLMTEYANGIKVKTTTYVEGSSEYPTFRLIMMDFLTYGEEHIL